MLTISKPYVASAYRNKLAELARSGEFEIGLIAPSKWGTQAYEQAKDEPETYWRKTLPIVLNGRNHFHMYRGLGPALNEFAPDLISVEEEHYSLVTYQVFRHARRLGAKTIFYTWQNIMKTYPPPFAQIEQAIFRQADAAVAGNDEAREILVAKGYRGPIAVIPQMGVELGRFAPEESSEDARRQAKSALGLDPNLYWIAYFGRLVEEKGVQDMLSSLAHLTTELPVGLLIVGSGPYADTLAQQASQLTTSIPVRFLAFVASHEVPRHLQAVDALCLPSHSRSNWKEQFGRVLIEAMAAEAIVIGSSSGEIPIVIGDAGLVFEEGSPAALATVIKALVENPSLQAALREKARRRVRSLYTNEIIAERFATLFRQVLRSRR